MVKYSREEKAKHLEEWEKVEKALGSTRRKTKSIPIPLPSG
jgi:hypothetical protein